MAEIVAGEAVGQPDQIHVPDEAESGFASETFTSTRYADKKLFMRKTNQRFMDCLLYTSPSPRDKRQSRMPSSA